MVRELGEEKANKLNLEANERLFRKYTLMLFKSRQTRKPESIEDLVSLFKKVWGTCCFDEMYVVEKGLEHKHKPYTKGECIILIIEPRGVINTGESKSELKAENDVWV